MQKHKFNIVGDTFTSKSNGNFGYSVWGKKSKHIDWVQDKTGDGTFYIDGFISQAFTDKLTGPKYAWILESAAILPQVVNWVKANSNTVMETFDTIFTHNAELVNIDPTKFKWVPAQGTWIKEPKIYDKTKMISMIASNKNMCSGHQKRLEWIERFKDQVDFFGRGYPTEIETKEDGLCDYMFSIAIENASYKTYFTEKLLDCFATGTIPVYYGSPDIGEYFNKDGIIDLSEEFDVSDEIYYSKMDAIQDNLERTKKMEVLEDFIWENYFS
jgi:hypothetical protein